MAKRKDSLNNKKLTANNLRVLIFKFFKKNFRKQLTQGQIAREFKNFDNSKDSIGNALERLRKKGKLLFKNDKFRLNPDFNESKIPKKIHEGFIDVTRSGAAYVVCNDLKRDVYVAGNRLNGALHGDLVKISKWIPRHRRRAEGEVIEVLTRATEHFIGTVYSIQKFGIVNAERHDFKVDIHVPLDKLKGAEEGDKVVIEITQWAENNRRKTFGKITSVLGKDNNNDMAMKTILINTGFMLDFPEEVILESESIPVILSEEEISKRRDMREVQTFTIDPVDAKDFDDALSIQYLENGHCEVGIHIADVSYYVQPETALDKEALKRSTSVYLVDRVLPMLPEKLSNELCSLRPNEDKFTFSAVFTFDNNLKITNRWFGRTATHSDRRFSYEEAQEVLEKEEGDFYAELKHLNKIAYHLREEKFKNGAIAFESEEVKFRLDENAVPIDVYTKERKDTHLLVEDFMLLANKEVARYIHKKGEGQEIPFVYRVHDTPDPDRIADFALFAKELGFKMEMQTPKQIAASFNRLSKLARKDESMRLLEPIAIRTMAKAAYTTENIGHYGLGFNFYTHFTSPIRRYSDVLVHRILQNNLDGASTQVDKIVLENQCKYISSQERKAMEAERTSTKYKQVEYIQNHIGEVFEGHISGMIERGIFVELKHSKCEGMVSFDTIMEPFDLDSSGLKAKGERSGKIYKMGDLVKVTVLEANLEKRQIEMAFAED